MATIWPEEPDEDERVEPDMWDEADAAWSRLKEDW
jgi:hypothetical protein